MTDIPPNEPEICEAEESARRFFVARAAQAIPGRARQILAQAGVGNPPRHDDRLEDETAGG